MWQLYESTCPWWFGSSVVEKMSAKCTFVSCAQSIRFCMLGILLTLLWQVHFISDYGFAVVKNNYQLIMYCNPHLHIFMSSIIVLFYCIIFLIAAVILSFILNHICFCFGFEFKYCSNETSFIIGPGFFWCFWRQFHQLNNCWSIRWRQFYCPFPKHINNNREQPVWWLHW